MTERDQPHARNGSTFDIARVDRRRFLAMLGSAGALGAVGCAPNAPLDVRATPPDHRLDPDRLADERVEQAGSLASGDLGGRTLVVVELQGGNDGLAMLQPTTRPRLHDLRPQLLADEADLHDAGGGFGWHPNLARLAGLGIAGVVGIGSDEPDFSHFEMEQRWWRGESARRATQATGFLGRLCDQLDVGAPVTGLSLGGGPTPALMADKAVTIGLSDPDAGWFLREDDPWLEVYRASLAAMSTGDPDDAVAMRSARGGLDDVTRFADALADVDRGDDDRYPWSELGQQLRFASQIVQLDAGVRVLHVRQGGYDTHSEQGWRHPELMNELDEALSVFVEDLQARDRWQDTLVVTTSEFGRRAEQNDGGTDHGGASTMLVCGAGASGIHGDAPDLASLDDGNVVATARFEDYYATIAEHWFGVPSDEVLPAGGDVIAGLLA